MFKPWNLSRGKGEREILIALQKVCYYYECKNFSEKKKETIIILWAKNWCMPEITWAPQMLLVVKNPSANEGDVRDLGLIPGPGRSPGEGYGYPL